MHQLSTMTYALTTPTRRQRGISLIESLIAIVVTALGILGILGVQMRTLSDTSTTVRRAQAIRLIEDLGERMRVNPNALSAIDTFISPLGDTPPIPDCGSGCKQVELAAYDLAVWKEAVRTTLPLGQAAIFIPPAEDGMPAGVRRQLGVMIAWRENERFKSTDSEYADYKKDIDATQVRDSSTGQLTPGAALACPANYVCHLQYLPVPARCAPYVPGGNSPAYFCPGA